MFRRRDDVGGPEPFMMKIMEKDAMVRMKRGMLAVFLMCVAIPAATSLLSSSGTGLTVIYSNDIDGNVKSCG